MTACLLRTAFAVFALALFSRMSPATAQDCPTASTARQGFVVERSRVPTEVAFADDGMVRNVYRMTSGETLLETTMFEGVFELDRIDRGRHTAFRPVTRLADLFPLKVGKKISADFESGEPPQTVRSKTLLDIKSRDSLYIGSCKYDVIVMDKSISRGGNAPAFVSTDYYAPDLKLIIAKQYGNPPRLGKYDKIYPAKK